MNVRLTGLFTLRSPLSHIGESLSTTSYLVQEPILQPSGVLAEVFCYSGNAWRGQLRDLCATYMLERIGAPQVSLDTFHLLFSGGRIGGDQIVDLERVKLWRRSVPMLAVFGGGVGNQILPGKIRVANSYPLCVEALPVLPSQHHEKAKTMSYRGMTFEKSFSRKDDAKDERLTSYLADPNTLQLTGDAPSRPTRRRLRTSGAAAAKPEDAGAEAPGGTVEREGPADQMRMTCELVAGGVQLATEIDCLDVTDVELGVLVSGLHLFSRSPHIGGQASRGYGRVILDYRIVDLDSGEEQPFLTAGDGVSLLAPPAAEAKGAYDQWLRQQYDAMLAAQGSEIRAALGVGAA